MRQTGPRSLGSSGDSFTPVGSPRATGSWTRPGDTPNSPVRSEDSSPPSPSTRPRRRPRASFYRWQSYRRPHGPGPGPGPPPLEVIEGLLGHSEAGDLDAWWKITLALTNGPTGDHHGDTSHSDLTALPAWRNADARVRSRLLDAAHRYVVGRRAEPDEWFFRRDVEYRPDLAGFKGLRLLSEAAQEQFGALGPDVWLGWAPAVVGYVTYGRRDDVDAQRRLVSCAYLHAPDEVLTWTARWITEQNRREHPFVGTRPWADLWGPGLAVVLLERVRDGSTKPPILEALLTDLLEHDNHEAREVAASRISGALADETSLRERPLATARALLTAATDAGWPTLWPVLVADPQFGRDLVASIAPAADHAAGESFLPRLTEVQAGEFYVWLARQFPHDEDEVHDGSHQVGTREFIERFRDGVLRHLERRGTAASLVALDGIARELPHLPWLPLVRLEAETVVMERTWVPHRPEDLWALAGDREARLVEGGDQLLEVIMESLGRYQQRLRGETPASFMLWDRQAAGDFRPKEEERLSDALKLHLADDLARRGVVANREVVIRGGTGGKAGERTDIHVDAVTRGTRPGVFDRVTVVVEVKGCWNRGVLTAMRDQLRDRYLGEGDCRHGLYVVGWFPVGQWDPGDYRRAVARRQLPPTLDEARSHFVAQAEGLSGGGRRVGAMVLDCSLS